jgi:Protein of unknown function (DUF3800)
MVIQTYIDDSYDEGGVHVMAGFLARAECWARFTAEWEELLPLCRIGNSGRRRFKMAEMKNKLDDVKLFLDVIRKHVSYQVAVIVREDDLERAKKRIWSHSADLAFSPREDIANIMIKFFGSQFFEVVIGDHTNDDWIKPDDKIDIYFDNDSAPEWSLDDWEPLTAQLPLYAQEHVGEKPRFVNDELFVPVQAADFLAWWIRKGCETGTEKSIIKDTFGPAEPGKLISGAYVHITEDDLVKNLIRSFEKSNAFPGLMNIYDSKIKPRPATARTVYDEGKMHRFKRLIDRALRSFRRGSMN